MNRCLGKSFWDFLIACLNHLLLTSMLSSLSMGNKKNQRDFYPRGVFRLRNYTVYRLQDRVCVDVSLYCQHLTRPGTCYAFQYTVVE